MRCMIQLLINVNRKFDTSLSVPKNNFDFQGFGLRGPILPVLHWISQFSPNPFFFSLTGLARLIALLRSSSRIENK